MGYVPKTKNGHTLSDVASLLQKSIRRGDLDRAGYALDQLFWRYEQYMWKRLLVISAEDCYGIITKEIIALKLASDTVNGKKDMNSKDPIFASKALTLLCMARKNRDACYVACNFMYPNRILDPDEIPHVDIGACELEDETMPDWVFDVHTLIGRQKGMTDFDMTVDEQAALNPIQLSLFDNGSWSNQFVEDSKRGIKRSDEEWRRIVEFIAEREPDPTHHGENWEMHEENWSQIDSPKAPVYDPEGRIGKK